LKQQPDKSIHSLESAELAAVIGELGQPAYRAKQVWQWLYQRMAVEWTAMTNIPETLKAGLNERVSLETVVPVETQGKTGSTRKILCKLADGEHIEEVLIPAPRRLTVCVSSQVGCRYRCAFCASGQAGFRRNLSAGELVAQVVFAARAAEQKPTHVVVMGVGEPLDNYDSVLKAIRIINDESGLNIGARRITISTCGVVPGIARLAEEKIQIELSVSLHAADDALRSQLMPVNRKYPLAQLVDACHAYTDKTGRIITFEYVLIGGVNDSRPDANKLVRLLEKLKCRVNLIPLSKVAEFGREASTVETAEMFMGVLDRGHINATLRASRGGDLDAACGQLRAGR